MKVDIIIPCYGKNEIVEKGVASLANQWRSEELTVYLVNDCSPNTPDNYQSVVEKFPSLNIKVLKTPQNSGQGLARQWGIDHSSSPYFMFCDEDDMYAPLACSIFMGVAESAEQQGKPISIAGGALISFDKYSYNVIPEHNVIWVNSKIFNRKFWEKHHIKFSKDSSRHSEDYCTMSKLFYCAQRDTEYQLVNIPQQGNDLYYWYPNPNSQSRSDDFYGEMLTPYTTRSTVEIINFMKDCRTVPFDEGFFRFDILNKYVYAWYCQYDWKWQQNKGFSPKEEEKEIERKAMEDIYNELKNYKYSIEEIASNIDAVCNRSDAHIVRDMETGEIDVDENIFDDLSEIIRVGKQWSKNESGAAPQHQQKFRTMTTQSK